MPSKVQQGRGTPKSPFPQRGTLWNLDPGIDSRNAVLAVVEIAKNSRNKYEYDPDLALFRLDRTLYSPMFYPGDYGFIPGTIASDQEPIDVVTLVDNPSFPGCVLRVRPIGLLDVMESNELDQKILAVPSGSPRFNTVRNLSDIASHVLAEIQYFFEIYKELEGEAIQRTEWRGPTEAWSVISEGRERYYGALRLGGRGREE